MNELKHENKNKTQKSKEGEFRDTRRRAATLEIVGGRIVRIQYSDGTWQTCDFPYSEEKVSELLTPPNYSDLDIYVNVWNCQANLCVVRTQNGKRVCTFEDELNLTEKQQEQLEELKLRVVYDDNDGALNWSGAYYPAPETLKKIVELLEGKL